MANIRMTRDFFLWCMSAIYLFAFSSLFVQIPGLYGDNGILPAKLVLQKITSEKAFSLEDLVKNQPTLLRLLPSLGLDTQSSMDLVCLGGIILSFVAMVTRHQRNTIVFLVLWMLYFSLFQVGQTFLWFQWDILLLEVGFLCVLVAPLNLFGLRSVWYHQHDHIVFFLVKWLLFRLMFASGIVKLTSNCPTWWGLTALNYHYETQCIPTPLAWFFHQFPDWFQRLSVVATYVIEIPVPFMYFSPVRSHRVFAFYAQCLLMFMIIFTGNYNFFNWLTIALGFALVDDNFIRKWMGKSPIEEKDTAESLPVIGRLWRPIRWALHILVYGSLIYWTVVLFNLKVKTKPFEVKSKITFRPKDLDRFLSVAVPVSIWIGVIALVAEIIGAVVRSLFHERGALRKVVNVAGCVVFGAVATAMFAISLVPHVRVSPKLGMSLPAKVQQLHLATHDYRLSSSYGLFRRMTGVEGRPEVIIEGSYYADHGWKEYNFLYKPGNVSTPLPVVAPHQPRLDWQMWFAALGTYEHNPWFINLVYRLLHNQKEVLELMDGNPFPDKPPTYIRATLYHYHFTRSDPKNARFSRSDYWKRSKVKEYLPVISNNEPSFTNYLKRTGIYQDASVKPDIKPSNALQTALVKIRQFVGQRDGLRTCLSLFVTGLVLSFLDPTIQLLKGPHS